MALIKCPECGNMITTHTSYCAKCGLPINKMFVCPECSNSMMVTDTNICSQCGYTKADNTHTAQSLINQDSVSSNSDSKEVYAQQLNVWESIVRSILPNHELNEWGLYSENGCPLSKSSLLLAAQKAFDISPEEKIYFIASQNILGGFTPNSKGLAITSRGIFFKDDSKKMGQWDVNGIATLKITKKTSSLIYIEDCSFIFPSCAVNVVHLLLDLQSAFNEKIKDVKLHQKSNSEILSANSQSDEAYTKYCENIYSDILIHYPIKNYHVWTGYGKPLTNLKLIIPARAAFSIPRDDKIFFITCRRTSLTECSQGFALTSHGFFYCDNNGKKGHLDLRELIKLKIYESFDTLEIGSLRFRVPTTASIGVMFHDIVHYVSSDLKKGILPPL